MKQLALLSLMLVGACEYVYAQPRNTPVDAGSLRGKRIQNPLQPLDRQGLGWDSANQRVGPVSYSMQSGAANYCAPAGASATTYTCNLTPALSAYSAGLIVVFKPDVNNSGASTLNVNSLGAKNIQKLSSGSLTALSAGDLDSDAVYTLRYNGTVFVVDPSSAATTSGIYQTVITDLKATRTSSTVLTFAAGDCWGTQKSSMTATITAGSGSGTWVAYCTDSQTVVVEHSTAAGLTVSCSGCVQTQVTTPTIPEGMRPIASGTMTSGAWDTTIVDRRGISNIRHTNGTGMNVACSGGVCTNAVDTAVVQIKTDTATTTGAADYSGSTTTKPMKVGTSDPGTCSVGEFLFRSDTGATKACTATNTWTALGGAAAANTSDVVYPFGIPFATVALNPGTANKQRTWTFTPAISYTVTKFRIQVSGTSGYTAWAITNAAGTSIITNATSNCQNDTGGSGNIKQCSWAGAVALTAGTTYRIVATPDGTTNGWFSISDSNYVAANFSNNSGTEAGYVISGSRLYGEATNNSTGTGGTLAVSVPLGTINSVTGSAQTPPAIVFIP